MLIKLLYVGLAAILCVGSYTFGVSAKRPVLVPAVPETAELKCGPDFGKDTPYLDQIRNTCPNVDTADDYVCIAKLSNEIVTDANAQTVALITNAQEAIKERTTKDGVPPAYASDFLSELPASIKAAQKSRDGYVDTICNLDSMLIYGGTGANLEREACRYYYTQQYLELIKKIREKLGNYFK